MQVRFAKGGERYCFVIFADPEIDGHAAHKAIQLNGSEMCGQALKVSAVAEQKAAKRRGNGEKGKQPPSIEEDDEAGEMAKKRFRPAPWRHDPTTGLTLPRKHRPEQNV